MNLKIALLQILPGKDLDENLLIGKKACEEAKEKGADVALFPEMWSDGYALPQDEAEIRKLAIEKDSEFVNTFRDLASELQMAIGITFLEEHEPKPLNSVIFFDRTGKEILHYSKVHPCAFADEKVLSGGDDFYVADLDFGRGCRGNRHGQRILVCCREKAEAEARKVREDSGAGQLSRNRRARHRHSQRPQFRL